MCPRACATPLWIRPGLPVRLFQRGQGSTTVKDWGDQPKGQEQLDALQCDVFICSLREPYSRGLIGSLAKTSVCVCVCVCVCVLVKQRGLVAWWLQSSPLHTLLC